MQNKKFNKCKAVKLAAAAIMSAVMFSMSTVPALAHTLPAADSNDVDYSTSEWYFIDENGNVSEYEPSLVEPHIIPCDHKWLDGTLSHHTKNKDGSCYIDYYYAKRCAKCTQIVETGLYATTTWDVCPH